MDTPRSDHRIGSEDYIGRMNLEGGRGVFQGNRPKIDFVFGKARPFLRPGMKVAEFGLGEGYLVRKLHDAGMSVTGLDLSGYLVERLGERTAAEGRTIRFIQADIADPGGYPLGELDAVFCLDILEHVDEEAYRQALENIHAALRDGGILVGTVPNQENLVRSMVCCPSCGHEFHRIGHRQSFDRAKLLGTLEGKFTVRKLGLVQPWTPVDLALRLKKAILYPFRRYAPGDTFYFVASRR
ncbi:class I SAM-dependent methyltransferase [bacterium]|nr:class I SAM-dependent methyltransferase [bacterium]